MKIKKVTIAGSGILGTQIAFQTAFHGFDVNLYDINAEALQKARTVSQHLKDVYIYDLGVTSEQADAAINRISYFTDLAAAVQDADLLIEAIPENPEIKTEFYQQLAKAAPAKTIFATNSSTFLPSQFEASTGRPDKFLALHFANQIWKSNTAEIMGHAGTDPIVFDTVVAFAKAIGMVALPLHKEQPGYILNSLLMPWLDAAVTLLVTEVADAPTIDKTWMLATGAPVGPFAILDIVGLTTAYNIFKMHADETNDPEKIKVAAYLKSNFIDTGKLGTATGEGFYQYPDPAYADPDFLK